MPQRREQQIHRAVIEHLKRRAAPGCLYIHVPNAPRSAVAGAMLKRMGMRAGVSDLLLWHQGESFALELKAPGGRPSIPQMEFISEFNRAGGYGCIAEGLDEALACLKTWGLIS